MEFLAGITGSKAILNSARLSALGRVVEDTSSYYWLGFTPQWKGDDRHHRIELKARKGLKVRSRKGFSDFSRARRRRWRGTWRAILERRAGAGERNGRRRLFWRSRTPRGGLLADPTFSYLETSHAKVLFRLAGRPGPVPRVVPARGGPAAASRSGRTPERLRRADRGTGGQRRGGGHRPPGEPGDRSEAW